MQYKETCEAIFLNRPNRFVANVLLNGEEITVHVKNTGRCRELLTNKARVILSKSDNLNRKYAYDLIAAYKPGLGWVNIDSQAPNQVMKEWLLSGESLFGKLDIVKPECVYGDSRFDFYLEKGLKKMFIEVKGCTLEIDKTGYFPDAPTQRGVKHLKELIKAKEAGYEAYIAFVIAMEGITEVLPNEMTHMEFAQAYYEAISKGVKVLKLGCRVSPDCLEISV